MNLIELTNQIEALKADLAEKTQQYTNYSNAVKGQIQALEKSRNVVSDGLDLGLIEIAESCVDFRGNPGDVRLGFHDSKYSATARQQAVAYAIKVISESDDPMAKEYIGIKNYRGFGDQREDHSYGMGPRHGSIVFSIGRKNLEEKLTEEQRNACIYYLMNWGKIFASRNKAA